MFSVRNPQGLSLPVLMAVALLAALISRPAAASTDQLISYVDQNTQKLVAQLNEEKDLYRQDPEAFYGRMEQALTGFVDFRRIAGRVMGRYARQTTREQRDEFVERFKRSLFESYAKALVSNASGFEIAVDSADINPRDDDRASVHLQVITDSGNRYQVTYSMYRDDKKDPWLMENVIVEGVNIGLAFRDRFAQEMESRRGNIDSVIDNWGDSVASLNLDEEMGTGDDSQ